MKRTKTRRKKKKKKKDIYNQNQMNWHTRTNKWSERESVLHESRVGQIGFHCPRSQRCGVKHSNDFGKYFPFFLKITINS